MKKLRIASIGIAIAILLSLMVFSQLSPLPYSESSVEQVTPEITLETREDCVATFFNATENVYGSCNSYHNYTSCSNSSGPNTACLGTQSISIFQCMTGEQEVEWNQTICTPQKKFYVEVDEGNGLSQKEFDYSDFGPCIRETENDCLVITCVSNDDGAFKGQFTDCNFGKSCQKTVICKNGVKIYYKDARNEFVEEDPTFVIEKMQLTEVG